MNLGSNNARSREHGKEGGEAVFLGEGKEAVTAPRSWKEVGAGRLCKRRTLADPLGHTDPSSAAGGGLLPGALLESRKGVGGYESSPASLLGGGRGEQRIGGKLLPLGKTRF